LCLKQKLSIAQANAMPLDDVVEAVGGPIRAGQWVVTAVAIDQRIECLMLTANDYQPLSLTSDYSELMKLFARKVAQGVCSEVVEHVVLNEWAGKTDVGPRRASDPVRKAINRLNDTMAKWATAPDGQPWLASRKGHGYQLNESVKWSIASQPLKSKLKRKSASVNSISTDGRTLQGNTPDKSHRLPASPLRVRKPR
jgi:hypothetical protein